MFKNIEITEYQRGFLFEKDTFKEILKPGKYKLWNIEKKYIKIYDVDKEFPLKEIIPEIILKNEKVLDEVDYVDVQDDEVVFHYEDGKFINVLSKGKHIFWNILRKHTFEKFDIREMEVPKEALKILNYNSGFSKFFRSYAIQPHEKGILMFDQIFQGIIESGTYHYWQNSTSVQVKTIDMRIQQLEVSGQEIMTEDKVPLRINFFSQFQIIDPKKVALEFKDYQQQLYVLMQLILREFVGTMKLDEILNKKNEIAAYVLDKIKEQENEYGVKFNFAGVKDIILPGEIREIMNTVLVAEKKALANVITRREETASTRSLMNTAKLMDENKTLYKLKELEYLERICERIGHISVGGNTGILEQLNALVASK